MALITVSGQPGCRHGGSSAAGGATPWIRAGYRLAVCASAFADEFGPSVEIPDKAFAPAAVSVVARLAAPAPPGRGRFEGAELPVSRLSRVAPGSCGRPRVAPHRFAHARAPPGASGRPRPPALTRGGTACRSANGSSAGPPRRPIPSIWCAIRSSSKSKASSRSSKVWRRGAGCAEVGLLSPAAEARLQFQMRLKLSAFGIFSSGGASLKNKCFVHPSEQVFANLLDFYRVAWEYEPRSFPGPMGARTAVSRRRSLPISTCPSSISTSSSPP